jgi:peptide/nickel transport system substrate-binding protein
MVWLRPLLYLAPVGVIAATLWLADQARALVYRTDGDLVVAVRAAPGVFNPLATSTGATREITELIFDRLVAMDDRLQPVPHLAARWGYRHRATVFFRSPEAAETASGALAAAKECWGDWGLTEANRDGDRIELVTTNPQPGWPEAVLATLDQSGFANPRLVRLTLRDTIEESLGDFLASSVEKGKVRQVSYRDGREADLFLDSDDTEGFLKELRLYYESNRNLEPKIDDRGETFGFVDLDFEIELRPDVRWHDGEALTADDLVFTFGEISRPGSPWSLRGAFDFVERLEKVDDHRVRVRCRKFFAPALEAWAKVPLLPEHRLRAAASPADWAAFFARPVGTGPYRLESTWPDGGVVLGSNQTYFGGAPRQATIRYRVLADPQSRLREMKLGLIDVFQPDEIERRWSAQTGRAEVMEDAARYHSFVAWNIDRPLFREATVRRALAQTVDLRGLLPTIASGHAEPWPGLFFPGSWLGSAPLPELKHDATAAEKALQSVGWTRDESDGLWRNADGEPITFSLAYDRADALHGELAGALARSWQAAGFAVRLEPAGWDDLLDKRLAPRDFDALLLGWEIDFSRDRWAVFHSSEAGPGGSNFCGLNDAQVDEWLAILRRSDEATTAQNAAESLQKRIVDLQPCFFLCATGRALAFRSGAVGQARPGKGGAWTNGAVEIGHQGFQPSRPWWVRAQPSAPAGQPKR